MIYALTGGKPYPRGFSRSTNLVTQLNGEVALRRVGKLQVDDNLLTGGRVDQNVGEVDEIERRVSDRARRRDCSPEVAPVLRHLAAESGRRIDPSDLCSGREEDPEDQDRDEAVECLVGPAHHRGRRRVAKDFEIPGATFLHASI